jgi:asparagine synthase (glutamine-hydrolysing)
MCGIFALLNEDGSGDVLPRAYIEEQFKKGQKRGPEFSTLQTVMLNTMFGFHRLAINGLNPESNQPLCYNDVVLICNGEIYNYKELYDMMDVKPISSSDCEVIIHLYIKYGIEQTLQMLDGEFSFALLDNRTYGGICKLYLARDPYGVRPLYWLKPNVVKPKRAHSFAFASEMKVLYSMYNKLNKLTRAERFQNRGDVRHTKYTIEQFAPGSYMSFVQPFGLCTQWSYVEQKIYHTPGFRSNMHQDNENMVDIIRNVQMHLINAVNKRCGATDRPVACLLSGGLDSSLVAALANEYHKEHNLPTLETYSIGLEGATDLAYAKEVAEHLGTKHTTIVLTEDDFLKAIPDVIASIESYDTTTVRASIGNWLLGKYISEHSTAKVILNGDGSDELAGGYLYMKYAGDSIEFDRECRRLLKDIHAFDVLRSDKSISSHGLEPRPPFLDRAWVDYYLSIPHKFRCLTDITDDSVMEKQLIRQAFSKEYYLNSNDAELLPNSVLWRRKEAFSDGVSTENRSLYKIIQEHTDKVVKDLLGDMFDYFKHIVASTSDTIARSHPDMAMVGDHLLPKTTEQFYYRQQFEKHYSGMGKILPYFWMPKYVNANDASARTLKLYKERK